MQHVQAAIAALCFTFVVPLTSGAVKVNGVTQTPVSGRYQINITSTTPNQSFTVTGNANDIIDYVRVNNPFPGSAVFLNVREETTPTSGVGYLGEVSVTGSGELWVGTISINGDVGSVPLATGSRIEAHKLDLLDVEGSVFAPVSALASTLDTTWFQVISIGGNLEADVINNHGPISNIFVEGDIEGTLTNPVEIFANNFMFSISAVNMTHVKIGSAVGSPPGSITPTMRVEDGVSATGNFLGSLSLLRMKKLIVDGDVTGDIVLGSTAQPFDNIAQIRIGRSFTAGSRMVLPHPSGPASPPGLGTQVMINNLLTGGQWLGEIRLGAANDPQSIVLANPSVDLLGLPEYDPTATEVGGGAVGEARFRIHGTAAALEFTQSGTTTTLAESSPNQVIYKTPSTAPETMNFAVPFYGFI